MPGKSPKLGSEIQISAQRLMALFRGSDAALGRFTPSPTSPSRTKVEGKAKTEKRAATLVDWEAHLRGEIGIGIIPIRSDDTASFGCIDIDVYENLDHRALAERIHNAKLPAFVCRSKSGGAHVYMFYVDGTSAAKVRRLSQALASWLDIVDEPEIFPKQDRLGDRGPKIGNWLNMPYFGGDETDRYAVQPTGEKRAPLSRFLEFAEQAILSAGELVELEQRLVDLASSPNTPGSDYAKSGRNSLLYTAGAQLKSVAGLSNATVRKALDVINREASPKDHPNFADGALDTSELDAIVQSLRKVEGDQQKSRAAEARRATDLPLSSLVMNAPALAKAEVPESEWIVEGWLRRPSINMIFAERGRGKTFWSLSLALSVAQGFDFGPYKIPQKWNTLYIDGEMPLADLKERIVSLSEVLPPNMHMLPSELVYRKARPLNINIPKQQERIDQLLFDMENNGQHPDLIIFDNLSSLGGGIDENDNSALDDQLQWFVELRHRGHAILLVHHAGKSGTQRGASRKEDLMDTVVELRKPDDQQPYPGPGAWFEMHFSKTRSMSPEPLWVDMHLAPGKSGMLGWRWHTQKIKKTNADETLMEIIRREPGGPVDLAKQIERPKQTIGDHLKQLELDGLITKPPPRATDLGIERAQRLFPSNEFWSRGEPF